MQEIEHILNILKETQIAINNKDILHLKELSNQTVHSASIYQDADNIVVAIIIYSISKILERADYQEYKDWDIFLESLKKHISKSILALKEKNINKFRFEMRKIRKAIAHLSGNFKKHVEEVFQKASINKASRIYEHGISMEKTAKLLGVTIWELAEYAGKTGIGDVQLNQTLSVKKRINLAIEIFKK